MEASSSSFPDAVWQSEVERIRRRREVLPNDYTNTDATPVSPAQTAGLALSGGGIRSATFCLGVLQHLARDDGALARRLDYLSTVSGGGYIGGLYGSLFLPEAHRQGGSGDDAQAFRIAAQAGYRALATDGTPASAFSAPQSDPQASTPSSGGEADDGWRRAWTPSRCLLWLRSNGRYLAPRGTGDIVFASALAIRNWVALHVVIGAALLAGLLIFATVRAQLFAHAAHWRAVESWFIPVTGDHLYWSTGWTFVGTVFVLLVLPPGLAYWLFHERDDDKNRLSPWPLVFHLATLVAAGALIVALRHHWPGETPLALFIAAGYAVVALLALEVAFTARRKARRGSAAEKSGRLKAMRNYCTQRMARRFLWVLAGAVLALVSTLGQTAYAYLQSSQISGVTLFGGGGLLTGALVFIVRHLMTVFSAKPDSWLARVPLTWIATVAAAALLLAMGTLWSLAVQSALWSGGPPLAVPVMSTEDDAKQRRIEWKVHNCVYVNPARGETVEDGCGSSGVSLPNFQDQRRCWSDPVRSATHTCHPSVLQLNWLFVWLALALAVGLVIGRFMGFLNLSTLHTLYAARLTRAYLGATNRERFLEKRRADGSCVVRARAVTEPLPSDSIPLDRYYDARVSGPLHIVNVTVNKTRPSHTTLVQRDRRGVGMAIVPDGLVVNHRFWKLAGHRPNGQWSPWARTATDAEDSPVVSDGERLGLGDWIAISGAAFSTGLGERTSIGLSLLTGLVNVRLGYWWDPSVRATGTTARDNAVPWWLRWSNRWVPTYGRLHQELFAAFDGPSPEQPLWFLTDGGHFENTAVYELIRRRVGVIVCCDVGADPDYAFEDVGNLVRKARSDFGAEMTLVTGDTLKHVVRDDALRSRFGAPEDFRCKPDARTACALMFRIDYPDGASSGATRKDPARSSLLIVLKPTAVQGLPLDLQHYASAHATFPQQTTGDQFFDEAQWESYRKLGEFVASMVLNRDALDLHKGWRSRLFDPAATGAP